MGTDIHPVVEVRGGDGKWKAVKPPEPPKDSSEYKWYRPESWTWDFPRNYDSFAVLADVRNGGFAGVETGEPFVPISKPRGLPNDADTGIGDREWAYGDHSFSWLLLSEILGYDWTRSRKQYGVVGPEDYREWKKTGRPKSWSGGACPATAYTVTHAEMEVLCEAPISGLSPCTRVEWMDADRDSCWALLRFVKAIQDTLPGVDPERIRIVFGFDS